MNRDPGERQARSGPEGAEKPPLFRASDFELRASVSPGVLSFIDLGAAFLALLVVTVRPVYSGLAVDLYRNILIYLFIFMTLLMMMLGWVLRKRLELHSPWMVACLLAFLAVAAGTVFVADYRFAAVTRALDIVTWCALGIALLQVVSTASRARIVLAAAVATLALLAAYGFYQRFVSLPRLLADLPSHIERLIASGKLQPDLVDTFLKRARGGDVYGPFVLANQFAGCLAVLLPAALAAAVALWRQGKTWGRAASAVAGVTALASLVILALTFSKGGILAFAVALGVGVLALFAARLRGRRSSAVAAAGVVLIAVLLTAQAAPPATQNYLGGSAEVRLEYWKAGWEMFKQHPLLGVGPGNFPDHYLLYRTPAGSETRYAHNDYLEIADEMGVVGLALYLAIWVTWFLSMRRREVAKPPEARAAPVAPDKWFALVVGLAGVAGIFLSPIFEEEPLLIPLWLGVWLAVYVILDFGFWILDYGPSAGASPGKSSIQNPKSKIQNQSPLPGPVYLRWAAAVGVLAFLVHTTIDFDFNDAGVTAPLVAMMAVGLAASRKEPSPALSVRLGTLRQLALVLLVVVPVGCVLYFVLIPLQNMSIAMEESAAARQNGDLDGHKQKLREAISAWPGNEKPYLDLALAEEVSIRGDPGAGRAPVERLLATAAAVNPGDPAPYKIWADLLAAQLRAAEEKGRTDLVRPLATLADEKLEQAIRRYPTHPELRLARARTLEKLGRAKEAAEEYRKALDLAEATSEKELKFKPEEVKEIREAIERLSGIPRKTDGG